MLWKSLRDGLTHIVGDSKCILSTESILYSQSTRALWLVNVLSLCGLKDKKFPETTELFPLSGSDVSPGCSLQLPPLSLLCFPSLLFQLLVPPLWELQQLHPSFSGTALPPHVHGFGRECGGLGHPYFGDAEARSDATPPQHHVHG